MPKLRFNVRKVADDSYKSAGSYGENNSRRTTQTFVQKYLVKALKNRAGDLYDGDPEDVSPSQIACLDLLPIVHKTCYFDLASGVIHPYAICLNKDIRRMRDNPMLFEVTCNFATQAMPTEDCKVVIKTVANPQDLSPQVTISNNGKDFVLYEDYDYNQCYRYVGIDEKYQTPVVTQRPFITLNITQFEYSISYSQMLERSYVVNNATWQGFPAGHWRLRCVGANEVDVQTRMGPQTWAKVQYEAVLGVNGYYDLNNSFVDIGWKQAIPLIASKYRDEVDPDVVTKFTHTGTSIPKLGNIDADGTKAADQLRHQYITHKRYKEGNFDAWIQKF